MMAGQTGEKLMSIVEEVMFEEIYKSGQYLDKNPLWHIEESPWKVKQIVRILTRNNIAPKTICEVGCGAGEVLKQLQKSLGGECILWGYEISPQAFAMCKGRANEKLHFKLADIRQERDVFFDLVLVLDVIEHLEDYFSFLREIRAKARHKVFHIPLDLSAQTILRRGALLKRRDLHAHIHYFTKEIAIQVLKDTGYEVLDYFYTPRSIELGSGLGQRILRLPRRLLSAIHKDLAVRLVGGFSLLVFAR